MYFECSTEIHTYVFFKSSVIQTNHSFSIVLPSFSFSDRILADITGVGTLSVMVVPLIHVVEI